MNLYLIQLKNRLLWSNLADDEICDILLDIDAYIETERLHHKTRKQIISDIGTPKQFARSLNGELAVHKNKRMNIRKLYLCIAWIWLVTVIVYSLSIFNERATTLSSFVPISLLMCLWAISGNSYVKSMYSTQKVKIWILLQGVFIVLSAMVIYLMNAGASKYLQMLDRKGTLSEFAVVFNKVVFCCTVFTIVIMLCSLVAFFVKADMLWFGLICQSVGLLYTIILYTNMVRFLVNTRIISYFPNIFISCCVVSIILYAYILVKKESAITKQVKGMLMYMIFERWLLRGF